MNISNKGINWLKSYEGKVVAKNGRHVIYDDKTGRPIPDGCPLPPGATIGYGHLVRPGENFRDGISECQATAILCTDLCIAERAVRENINVTLAQHQYDALVALAYNIGAGAFAKSTVVKYINNPSFTSVRYSSLEKAWCAWTRSNGVVMPGLIRRRNAEWQLYCSGIYR